MFNKNFPISLSHHDMIDKENIRQLDVAHCGHCPARLYRSDRRKYGRDGSHENKRAQRETPDGRA
ncbi:MAG: hypothetical protein MR959_06685 [Selenomonas bovis]|nr:hypothetical protein [Selenomonas bovis]